MKIKALCFLFICLFMATSVWAKDMKVAVIDLQEVLQKCEPGQEAMEDLEEEYKSMQSRLEKKKSAIDQLREEMEKQALVLSQEAKIDKEAEYKDKVREWKDLYQKYQKKMQLKREQLRQPIIEKIVEVVKDYGKSNNYTLIMDTQNSGVIYNEQGIEITNKIITRVNSSWEKKK